MRRNLILVYLIAGFSCEFFANHEKVSNSENHPKAETRFWVSTGVHSNNLDDYGDKFGRGFNGHAGFIKELSPDADFLFGYSYWEASEESHVVTPSVQKYVSHGFSMGLDFRLFTIYMADFIFGGQATYEVFEERGRNLFGARANFKLSIPVLSERMSILLSSGYSTAGQPFEIAGSGMGYSFFSYLAGVELNLSKIFKSN